MASNNTSNSTVERTSDTEKAQGTPLGQILAECGFNQVGRHVIPARKAEFAPVPKDLNERVRRQLETRYPAGIYSHQAEAITAGLNGRDICLATSTASGKSLVFMALAAHTLLNNPKARVLVLYPAKALIQDQLAKWNDLLGALNLKAGFIDGSVRLTQRNEILQTHRLILMTPDVAHAWFMGRLNDRAVTSFRTNLQLLVLDETHVYDGVFGTNMAFLLRRLQAVSGPHRLVCSTATLGEPGVFVQQLTGRQVVEIGADRQTSAAARKDILVVRHNGGDAFDASTQLLRKLAHEFSGRFLAFGDSRRLVELITASSQRSQSDSEDGDSENSQAYGEVKIANGILPYRSGYESHDRQQIQQALTDGTLKGVVATSAMEMGVDIGEIDLVVLLDTPASMKSFWQRAGRAGRKNRGTCVLIDSRSTLADGDEALSTYLQRPVEPNWLYLHNRYAQYGNALCAAHELGQLEDTGDRSHFGSLPPQFNEFLDNELNPSAVVPTDLYPLKQAAQSSPHHEFPLRNGIEKNFKILTQQGERCGEVGFAQALREAYPGALYYYMARPYRVQRLHFRTGEITVKRERSYSTKPIRSAMVFPDFATGALRVQRSESVVLAEAEMQVSERVTGFKEMRGKTESTHNYGPGSCYSQQPLSRYIRTTGVCWFTKVPALASDAVAQSIVEAFCCANGIQPKDLGIGRCHANPNAGFKDSLTGVCIFDNSNGSLRLTERLGIDFEEIVAAAARNEIARGRSDVAQLLEQLRDQIRDLPQPSASLAKPSGQQATGTETTEEWISIFASGSQVLLRTPSETQEVTIEDHIYTPSGLQYKLAHPSSTVRWMVPATALEPIHGVTVSHFYNLMTGETKAAA